MTVPLHFEDGALMVLDQRELPARETWLRCETPGEVATAIASLAVRGAPAIGLAAAYGLALSVGHGERCSVETRVRVEEAARTLGSARPTGVDLRHALERGLRAYEIAESAGGEAAEALLTSAERLAEERHAADRRLAALGAERFREGDRALTHCNAGALATGGYGTAGGVLRSAWESGRLAHAWVCETRPVLQGARLTAWELQRAGVPFRLIADSAAGSLMARGLVEAVVVGADRVAENGDVANKVGTYPLAVLADRHGVPFYVAAPVSTLDPDTPDGAAIPIEERDPGEITSVLGQATAPAGVEAANPAFDVTPAELVTALICEAGVLEPPYGESIARVAGG